MRASSTAIERINKACRAFALLALAAVAASVVATPAAAADITATVKDRDGRPVADAVIVAVPAEGMPRFAPSTAREIVDQIDMEFVPRVKPILVGSSVYFPNKDNIRHQVYSFSGAKQFELPLYAGTPAKPVVFDKPGVVVLGCNIHDWMVGYIYVSESPYFATTGPDGSVQLKDLPPHRYTVRIWHPRLTRAEEDTRQSVDLIANARVTLAWGLALRPDMRIRRAPVAGSHGHY
jgi:plastocyanin